MVDAPLQDVKGLAILKEQGTWVLTGMLLPPLSPVEGAPVPDMSSCVVTISVCTEEM